MNDLLHQFLPYFKDYRRQLLFAVIGMGLVAATSAGIAYLIKPVLDEIFIAKDQTMLTLLPLAIIIVYVLKGIGLYIQAYYTKYIGNDVVRRVRDQLLDRLIYLDLGFFQENKKGTLISRVSSDTSRIQSLISTAIPMMIRDLFTALALMVVVIYQNPKLAFLALVVIPAAAYPMRILGKKVKKASKNSQESTANMVSRLNEIFNNMEVIKANNAEEYEKERYHQDNRRFFHFTMKMTRANTLVSPLMETLGALGVALVIWFGGKEVIEGTMTVGTFFSFTAALFMLYGPVKSFSSNYNRMNDASAAWERIKEFMVLTPAIANGEHPLPRTIESVSFHNVHLYYGTHHALQGIDMEVRPGQMLALVGDSGGGKSSLVNLLPRFFDPSSGEVRINGTDIRGFELKALRERIALVSQRIFIFNDTIAANVAYGHIQDDAKVQKALQEANAWSFVQSLPEGIHTRLEDFGTNLSGGQRQRIAIARAIYKDPDILILDEATSALDNQSEAAIQEAMERLSENKITFVIAHRLSTVKKADAIAVLKHGQVVCMGSEAALLETCEEFKRLKAFH